MSLCQTVPCRPVAGCQRPEKHIQLLLPDLLDGSKLLQIHLIASGILTGQFFRRSLLFPLFLSALQIGNTFLVAVMPIYRDLIQFQVTVDQIPLILRKLPSRKTLSDLLLGHLKSGALCQEKKLTQSLLKCCLLFHNLSFPAFFPHLSSPLLLLSSLKRRIF